MRKRGPILVGGGIALLIASQFFDFGLGFQDGSGPGDATDPNAQVSMDPSVSRSTAESKREIAEDEMSEESIPRFVPTAEPVLPDVVDILIDGSQYLVISQAGEGAREPMTLDQIVAMAATVDGEPSGIRVRVARTPNAVASAEAAVMKRLADAGLAADEIDARRQLVELN
ncbi:hypothetical protein [Allorhodopirellula heiligendammensis]|uniref:Biopolymer transport protein ExbD/TolR n=1 Tax=Allorhodopirellula heiligendammensis TaxID=2714739 RepID=A0A5C6BH50_9BACT|nr:hypothetical protein [Allorhodopirellula heiligendammensis]TWU10616.1 hypothetical protein Poly21_45220 [Allorhodopirellula heiligendammensis]